ncbi:hypothetical protein CO057_01460 [Candidatus Uhrbacteria bacterium CG_4_9_14_0_2_um_filter_41_50]|uniref:Transcription elongation factor GreA n=1 Tax=Candidatus Uhrbacteria bacterium CG_4_9_14_0_2_um_filter_41_50 TaxID=1975031 RepID=A0A2M8EPR0_9BACT|nr:MAG: hypothetical protein COZ45_03840 [Candidatus Uhrbacteria bacterium CG_4_10_14_3_um_filter_41_21]PIZ54731.1 MAG: hypothetical protein COY24_02765 [Candidatus Uhrbacteria bacterium CG_4_10_14_0_2_um_filter_41_21]PJB85104.1 MAG: hypothetical protein CO086_00110 [Candidatus Uhrbacteria bacterium CG_4_9_14_0_8_um_filter_41_16]PJC24712.1 MAG: hypothetical protein CO057_01460 [Candidatus Uhrbacteria bacterium CG_4_9_14_0_2_um_filter_41_50]PJE75454.1 MAG: hypothetical protein COV03_00110 [Candi
MELSAVINHSDNMRLPTRKSEKLNKQDNGPVYLTKSGIEKLKRQILSLQLQTPELIKEVTRTQAMGDLSENAAYQEAKHQMRRAESKLFYSKERLKNAIEIQKDENDDTVHLGVKVIVEINGNQKIFEIVGPVEADPLHGRISYVSPLGLGLNGKRADDSVSVNGFEYKILEVK